MRDNTLKQEAALLDRHPVGSVPDAAPETAFSRPCSP
jgi:hypothetical protein